MFSMLVIDVTNWSDAAIAFLQSLGAYGIPGDGCECFYLRGN